MRVQIQEEESSRDASADSRQDLCVHDLRCRCLHPLEEPVRMQRRSKDYEAVRVMFLAPDNNGRSSIEFSANELASHIHRRAS